MERCKAAKITILLKWLIFWENTIGSFIVKRFYDEEFLEVKENYPRTNINISIGISLKRLILWC